MGETKKQIGRVAARGLVILTVLAGNAWAARPADVMSFHFTLQESCTGGPPGTFTPDGDIMKPAFLGFAHVAGTITFDPRTGTFSQTDEAVFQFPPFFNFEIPEGTPQGIYPFLVFQGGCTGQFRLNDDLSFTLEDITCRTESKNSPSSGGISTITGMSAKGQFAADYQSFVTSSLRLVIEPGNDAYGNQFERLCAKTSQGVRLPKR